MANRSGQVGALIPSPKDSAEDILLPLLVLLRELRKLSIKRPEKIIHHCCFRRSPRLDIRQWFLAFHRLGGRRRAGNETGVEL